jgi:cell division protein FtsI/penicillin-binding protein 2
MAEYQPVRYRRVLTQVARGGERLDILYLGRFNAVRGARLDATPLASCDGRACTHPEQAGQASLILDAGATEVEIELSPLPAAALKGSLEDGFRHIRVQAGQLRWVSPDVTPSSAPKHATVSLTARGGELLWQDGPSPLARELGLQALLGVHPQHEEGIAGNLARLGELGRLYVHARLTLDVELQRQASHVLDCVGYRQGRWDGQSCLDAKTVPAMRRAGLVLLDAGSGDILAAAGAPLPPEQVTWEDLRNFDQANPAQSPLRVHAWQHDGSARRAAGSTFKQITALGLESAARDRPELEALLAGPTVDTLARIAQSRGDAFDPRSGCYPAPCVGSPTQTSNHEGHRPISYAVAGRLGLKEVLSSSLNTWFAWLYEMTDASLRGLRPDGVPDLLEIDGRATNAARPVLKMARFLGFDAPLRLDGGLLPAEARWATWDALQATPSHVDPISNRHALRQFAIGLRMQVTPLQMARVSAAIGQGQLVQPRLLAELDGKLATDMPLKPLDVRLDRIRAGMKLVVESGTAASAFAGQKREAWRRGLHGKTGTASLNSGKDNSQNSNTVWFSGWLDPGSIPGENRRIAFACFITHSNETGGGHAAPVVAALLDRWSERSGVK